MNEVAQQTNMFSVLDQSIAKVFQQTPITAKDGSNAGMSMTLRKRKEIAAEFDLKRKDQKAELDLAILKESDNAFRLAKGHIAGLNGEWTLAKLSTRTLSSGVRQITLVTREVKRNAGPTDEAVAKAWNVDIKDVETVKAMLIESAKQQAAKQVEVEAVKTDEDNAIDQQAAPTPETEENPAKDAQ